MYEVVKKVVQQLFTISESQWVPFLLVVVIITLILTRR